MLPKYAKYVNYQQHWSYNCQFFVDYLFLLFGEKGVEKRQVIDYIQSRNLI